MKKKQNYMILYCGDWNGKGFLYQIYGAKKPNGERDIIGAALDTPGGWTFKQARS